MNDSNSNDQAQDLTEIADSSEAATNPAPEEEPKTAPTKRKRASAWPGAIAILALLATSSGAVYFWQQNESIKQRLTIAETRVADQDARGQREIRELGTQAMTRINSLEGNTKRIGSMQTEMQRAMDSVRHFAAKGPVGWVLAEVEFLLKIANHRVLLNQDPETALAALKSADERLRSLADPGLIPVREKIAEEMQALKSIPKVDRDGIALELKAMAREVDSLPLPGKPDLSRGEERQPILALSEEFEWSELPQRIWNEIKSLVKVRSHDQSVPMLLPPDEQQFLYWNLRLQLESARLNAMRSQQDAYLADLASLKTALQSNFLVGKPETKAFLKQIKALEGMNVSPQLPDIAGSLRILRAQSSKVLATATE